MQPYASDIFFTPAVKAIQAERGSRDAYHEYEEAGFRTDITPELARRLQAADSLYLASASAAGQPYIQHRGGAPGFLRALDHQTLGFADLRGNRQYITLGNLSENNRVMLFIMDYAARTRVKIWGHARVVTAAENPELVRALTPPGARIPAEQAILVTVEVWDTNCPQHIPQKFPAAAVAEAVAGLQARIAELEAEVARVRGV